MDEIGLELGEEPTNEEITKLFCEKYLDAAFYKWTVAKETGFQTGQMSNPQTCEYMQIVSANNDHSIEVRNFKGSPEKAR